MYYGIDLVQYVAEDRDPSLILALHARLPEGSMTRALQRAKDEGDVNDWPHFMDAGREYRVLAGIYDAVNLNTTATGNFKKRPKIDPWPVPELAVKLARKKAKSRSLAAIFGGLKGRTRMGPNGELTPEEDADG